MSAKRWVVTALGGDKPGIVAGVAEVLYGLGCNLEDSAMTRLEGEFAIMLIFSAPPAVSDKKLADAFAPLEKKLKLVIHLKPLSASEGRAPAASTAPHVISVYGADRPGIVFRVSQALAKAKVNITDVQTHRSEAAKTSRGPSLYMLLLEVELPRGLTPQALEKTLKALASELGVEVSVRSAEANVL